MVNPLRYSELIGPMGACFPEARLSEAWTPYQRLRMIFDPAIGLVEGTIFPELVRPYTPQPNSPGWY